MKKLLLPLWFVCSTTALSGQTLQRIDSLKKLDKNKTDQFDVLNRIAWEYHNLNQDSTIHYAQQAFELGKKRGLKKNLARPLNYIGVAYEYRGEAIDAYDFYKQALTLAISQNDEPQIAYANNNTGRLFFDQGNVMRSEECFSKALTLFEKLRDSSGIAYVYLNLAHLYAFQKEYKKAEKYFMLVYQIRLHLSGMPITSALLQLGIFYREADQLDKSNDYFKKADSLCKSRHDDISRAEVSIQLAENYLMESNLSEANKLASRGLSYALNNNLSRELPRAYLVIGKISFAQKDYNKAKAFFEKVIESRRPLGDFELRMNAHFYLGQIYSKMSGQKEYELKNQNQYLILRDSIKGQDLAKQIDRLKFQFKMELEQRKKENELLKTIELSNNTIIRKQQTLNVVYGVALVIIMGIAFLLYRTVRLKQKHNNELAEKQEEILLQSEKLAHQNIEMEKINSNLEALVEQRTRTIKEQHERLVEFAYFNSHQIRGPLARILGLIALVDLEFKDAFGPYTQMLTQAGTELDIAIRKVNELLDDGY